jgi:CO dehydrogenase/acetyl-CoA synthase beta subunit
MGLFDEPLESIISYRKIWKVEGLLQEYDHHSTPSWPEKASLVLKDDTALELGATSSTSLFLLLWTDRSDLLHHGTISLFGPDLAQVSEESLPFAQIVLVQGGFPDEYDAYRELRDVVYDTHLWGVSQRIWPNRMQIWCRISREALGQGFSLGKYGAALIRRLEALERVEGVEVIFITGEKSEIERLRPLAEKAQDRLDALIKMYEEMNFDCETCEYVEVCEEVVELKKIRERLREEREGG